jgi:hypothetical protein
MPNYGLIYLSIQECDCDLLQIDLCFFERTSIFWQGINDTLIFAFQEKLRRQSKSLLECEKQNKSLLSDLGRIRKKLLQFWYKMRNEICYYCA